MTFRGLKRWALTRIWNKGDTFKVGVIFEYASKEAFEANVQYLEKSFSTLPKIKQTTIGGCPLMGSFALPCKICIRKHSTVHEVAAH